MSSGNAVRWGILGVAKINDRLLPAFRGMSNGKLVAIASRSLEKARDAATKAEIPQAFGSYEALLADPNIDAVYIPLPNHLHDEWTRKAAAAGKHVLCEKPLTPTALEAQALVDYCEKRGVKLMDGFMWPHHPRTAEIKKHFVDGTIGRVERVDASFTFQLPRDPKNIRLQSQAAGGSLADVGCYPVYGIRWAMDAEPVRVFATAEYDFDVDIKMSAMLWFSDDRMASFDCGFTLPLRQRMEIAGSKGVLRVPRMWLPLETGAYSIQIGEQIENVHSRPCQSQIVCMLENFSSAIINNKPVSPSPIEAVKTLKVMDALAKSARENRIIDV